MPFMSELPPMPEFGDAAMVTRLLDPRLSTDGLWEPDDLGSIWEHQLDACIWHDLALLGAASALLAEQVCRLHAPPVVRFRDLLEHPAPRQDLLGLVRQFADAALHAPVPHLPRAIAVLLHNIAVLRAEQAHGVWITDLRRDDVRGTVQWLLGETWLGEASRAVLREGQIRLAAERDA